MSPFIKGGFYITSTTRIKIMKQLFDSFKSTSLEILPNLKERYGLLLRHDLVSVLTIAKRRTDCF
jgi:hypothetical protein